MRYFYILTIFIFIAIRSSDKNKNEILDRQTKKLGIEVLPYINENKSGLDKLLKQMILLEKKIINLFVIKGDSKIFNYNSEDFDSPF
jgi:hypothetical protein